MDARSACSFTNITAWALRTLFESFSAQLVSSSFNSVTSCSLKISGTALWILQPTGTTNGYPSAKEQAFQETQPCRFSMEARRRA